MRRGDSVPAESLPAIITSAATPTPSVPSVSTPLSSATTNLKRKRDRERDRDRDRRPSLSASPAPQPVTASTESAMTSIPSPMPLLPRGGTPMSREATGKARKEQYYDQLPLQPGRKVAFKVPNKGKDKAEDETGEEAWILATIRKCINQDKMRYEVQDADDANTSWNTTLRSIIPLPDPSAPPSSSANPSNLEDYPKGTQVLGLYPETTSFYRATVVAPPLPGTGHGLGVRFGSRLEQGAGSEKGHYLLLFVDDDDKMSVVHKDLVLLAPGTTYP
ncbi:hypothetical protein EHS25_010036 [Saitozyma podzolica]|uniref:SGF29 C-terminal domain-containing protein n=1 Tax=Saitozyma podzolica TaxID=1890683 RepID=A0A427YIG1_9TREE|nr:hypothetical protein EHS25_010036 [Saitozyma podzolica]